MTQTYATMNENEANELGWEQFEVQSKSDFAPPVGWVKVTGVDIEGYAPPEIANDDLLLNAYLGGAASAALSADQQAIAEKQDAAMLESVESLRDCTDTLNPVREALAENREDGFYYTAKEVLSGELAKVQQALAECSSELI